MNKREKAYRIYIEQYEEIPIAQIAAKVGVDASYLSKVAKRDKWRLQRKVFWQEKLNDQSPQTMLKKLEEQGEEETSDHGLKPCQTMSNHVNDKEIEIWQQNKKTWFVKAGNAVSKVLDEILKDLDTRLSERRKSQIIKDLLSTIQAGQSIYGRPDDSIENQNTITYVSKYAKKVQEKERK